MKRGSVVVGYLDNGHWSASFGLSYRDLLLRDALGSQRIVRKDGKELRQVCGTGGIVAGRNKVAGDFLANTDGEWLWFVDTDMSFAPDTVDRLVATADQATRPVVGGLCFKLTRVRPERAECLYAGRYVIQPTLYEYVEVDDGEVGFRPVADYPRDRAVQVSATGAACMLIHRRVLEKVQRRYGDGTWFDPITHPTGHGDGKPRTFSEDLSFCVRLAAVDLPVWCHTGVRTAHHKGGIYLDENAFDAQQAAPAAAKAPTEVDSGLAVA